jgi:hypothetical protein
MLEKLLESFDSENSFCINNTHIFHEDQIYNVFNMRDLAELKELVDDLREEGLITPIICNFYSTTARYEATRTPTP